jgi:hypothetical protein
VRRSHLDLTINGYVVGQFPNAPIVVAMLALLASWLLNEGSTAWDLARAVFHLAFALWAWLELSDGINLFRRLLGAAGIAYVIASLAGVV